MNEAEDDLQRQCLTHPENVNIILRLCVLEAKEERLARRVVALQAVITLIIAGVVYGLSGALQYTEHAGQYAAAVLGGGLVSVLNGALLAWRMSRAAQHSASEAQHPGSAHRQLRLMYLYAVERFLVVAVLLGMCLAVLKLTPLAVLGGFVMGQAVLLAARLILFRLN